MDIIAHIVVSGLALTLIWLLSGTIITSIERIAHHYNKTGFFVAFVVLGTLSSITEISVLINSIAKKVPLLSIGNLVGASIVLMLLIVPFVAIMNRGISLSHTLSLRGLLFSLITIALPTILLADGNLTKTESIALIISYTLLVYRLNKENPLTVETIVDTMMDKQAPHISVDIGKVVVSAFFILISGSVLVTETTSLAYTFGIPASVVGLIGLSIGTNVPEISIAFRSIINNKQSIAFGDYLGSASANTLLMGILGLLISKTEFNATPFIESLFVIIIGLSLIYIYGKSGRVISRKEGIIIICLYIFYLLVQVLNPLIF